MIKTTSGRYKWDDPMVHVITATYPDNHSEILRVVEGDEEAKEIFFKMLNEEPNCKLSITRASFIPKKQEADSVSNLMKRFDVEINEDWKEWISKIPDLHFDSDWDVRIVPPFGGALARFQVRKGNRFASVYFDGYDQLGCVGHPYFELYPWDNDVKRYSVDEVDELIKDIRYLMNE